MIHRPHFEAEAEVQSLLERGWRLFPCVAHTKKPLLKGWPTRASSDTATIRKWAEKYPGCNWAVATGPESGFWVLDIDGEKGRASAAVLEAQHGPLPGTLISRTGREDGGEHRLFAWPVDHNIRNSTSKLGDGLHVRGAGGYIVVPPSIHPTGRAYQWANPNVPIADAPQWLLEKLTTPQRYVRTPAAEIGILLPGKRNDGLTRLGGALRRNGSTQGEIEAALLAANSRRCRPPLGEAEVSKIAASVARYGPGGPDPLETAWKATEGRTYLSRYERFLALAHQLQYTRIGMAIALPVQRISELMGIHWTTVSQYRKRAVTDALLEPAGEYIPHRRAGLYRVPVRAETLLKNLTSGLVRVPENPPSENPIVRMNSVSRSELGNSRSESARKPNDTSWSAGAGKVSRAQRCYLSGRGCRNTGGCAMKAR